MEFPAPGHIGNESVDGSSVAVFFFEDKKLRQGSTGHSYRKAYTVCGSSQREKMGNSIEKLTGYPFRPY